jgi:DNA mismatch repair ATPase MutS
MSEHNTNELRAFSLLAPDKGGSYSPLSSDTENDLSVDFLVESISRNSNERKVIKDILLKMPADERIISYRRAVYTELRQSPELCEKLYDIFEGMRFFTKDGQKHLEKGATIWELLSKLKYLENYISSVIELNKAIDGLEFTSEGMKQFAALIRDIYGNSGFGELLKDIEIVSEDIRHVRSITIGVNLDENFYPMETGIIALNRFWFEEQSMLKRFLKYHRKDQLSDEDLMAFSMEIPDDNMAESLNKYERKYRGVARQPSANPLMNNLNSIIERMLPSTTAKLRRVLHKYVDVSGYVLADLADELLFYLRFIELEKQLTASGVPCCIGEPSDGDTVFRDFYNVKLAICRGKGTVEEEIVCNDLEFTREKTVNILTGPNRGGKTIFTQGVGLAFLLYQSGVFVPASSARVRLCDGIYTHFPVEEERTVSLGRLGEEAERFNEICKKATGSSLLLFNESFATTSHTESVYIAEDVLRYLCCIGARTFFNTHMHELAEDTDKFNKAEGTMCKAVSVVMENEGGKRSYKISYKAPDGKSYAHEIAYKYGITFEQLMENI